MNSTTLSPTSPSWFKTQLLSFLSLILFSFLLVGCGSGGGGGSSNTNTSKEDNNSNTTPPSSSKDITGFTFAKDVIKNASISETEVNITIDYYSNHTTPIVTHTGKDYSPKGAINLLTIPKVYTVTAEDNTNKSYNVTVRRAFVVSDEAELTNAIDTITNATKNDPISYITILITNDINLTKAKNITIPSDWKNRNIRLEKHNSPLREIVITGLTIESDDIVGIADVYIDNGKGNITNPRSSKELTSFSFDGDVIKPFMVNGTNVDITIDYYYSTSPKPIVTHTGASYSPNGTINFANMPKTYTITAQDNTNKSYNVIIRRALIVSDETQLKDAIDTIENAITLTPSLANHITILITKDINLTGVNQRTIPDSWKDRNIILEKYNPALSVVTIKGLEGDEIVELTGVKIERTIVAVAAGLVHSLALTSGGKLWVTGNNGVGQLGLGDTNNQTSFKLVTISSLTSGTKIVSVAAGYYHSLALDSDGKIWVTGSNSYGELGLGNNTNQNKFQPITSGSIANAKIVSIAAGIDHSLALDNDGKIWATGWNIYGQLGLGNSGSGTNRNSFQLVAINGLTPGAKIVSIAAGYLHSLALDSEGKLWATGHNGYGQLSLSNYSTTSFQSVTIKGLAPGAKIVSIAAGLRHSLALDSDGKLWATGYNHDGELGLGKYSYTENEFQLVTISGTMPFAKVISIAAGNLYSFAMTNDSSRLWATGRNGEGQLGLGNNNYQTSFQLASNAKIVFIAAHWEHSLVVTSDGKLWVTGSNGAGQLGLGDDGGCNVFTPAPPF
jgi:alpha-tubulin suppressor-like RCC1 family protein